MEEEAIILLVAVLIGLLVTVLLVGASLDKKLDIIQEAINQLAKRERYNYFKTTEWLVQKDEEETER